MKTDLEAINDSIAHWERMINWVKGLNPNDHPDSGLMRDYISESWYSDDCSLCQNYLECYGCPFVKYLDYSCDNEESGPWPMVSKAKTWGEWLDASQVMLETLKSLKEKAEKI